MWISADGMVWERVDDTEAFGDDEAQQQMSAIVSGQEMLVAAGSETMGRETDGAVWTSLDGITWRRQPTTLAMSAFTDIGRSEGVRDLVATQDRFIALGRERRGHDDDADIWIGLLGD